jgi:P-type Mg2+ transporter
MSIFAVDNAWWLTPMIEATPSETETGLTAAEADHQLLVFGYNLFGDSLEPALWLQFLSRFKNPLIILLIVASAVSAFTGEVINFFIISVIVLLSVTLDFFQEHRANQAAAHLRQSISLKVTVVRDGKQQEIDVKKIVPGDLVMLSAGSLVPADCRVLQSRDFFVNQAMITGESYPVEKRAGQLDVNSTSLQDATNAVFMGTSVLSGSAQVRVINTGARTAMGDIALSLTQASPPTAFELGTQRFGLLIMRLTILLVLFVLFVNTFMHRPWLESFLFSVALAVGLTPELLPMVVSITLTRGALLMAKQEVIVKRLSAIQDLGAMDVLCTDKTGTLTEAKIKLEQHIDPIGQSSERVLELAYLNSFFETGLKSSLDEAILNHEHISTEEWIKIDEVPFDFERRRVSVLLEKNNERLEGKKERWLIVKGAPDEIISLCTQYENLTETSLISLDGKAIENLRSVRMGLEQEGFRVLGIAWRKVPLDHTHAVVSDEIELVFSGFAGFLDPPKASAREALAALAKSAVIVKIVTGDSELVTQHLCKLLDLAVTGVLTGKEIDQLDDHALRIKVEDTNLFCRVNPRQKNRIILSLKSRGHVVGYLGDGINDAPALHSADVGLSVESAVDVAKDAADMILLNHDLQVLYKGVCEGRRTFANTLKYIMMGTSSNFGNMFSMAGAALFLPFLPMQPTQILLNNLLYDLSEIPIPLDQVDNEELRKPKSLDTKFIRNFMLVIGPISSLFDFITFYVLLQVLHSDEKSFQTGWFIESLCTQVLVIFIIRTRGNPMKSHPHQVLTMTSLFVVSMGALLTITPLGTYVGLTPLPLAFYGILAILIVSYLILVEVAKRIFYRWGLVA